MGRIPARKSLVAVALQGLLTAGCGTTGSEESRLTMLLSTNSATIAQGSNSTVLVNITRSNFDKPITLVAEGTLPAGVTATFSINPIPTGLVASTLTIAAAGSATPGVATITIRATGEGVAEQSAMISVTVNVTGTFTLGMLAPSHTVAAGGGGKATVLVTRAGGNGASVTLGVSGLPAGVTASFDQSPTTQGAASLSFTATGAAAPGSYPLTVTGSAPGVTPDQQTSLTLNVIAPPATASVTVTFCSTGIPAWFAFQNEGFGWQRATASANTFTFSATQRVAVAYTFLIGSESQVNVLYLTRSELASFSDRDCRGPKTLNGTTVGVNPGQSALVVMGIGDDATDGSGPFVLADLATRPLDLVATRGVFSNFGYLAPDRMIVRRAVDLATGSTIPPLDFGAAESFAPVAHTLTVTGLGPSDFVEFQNNLFSATSTFGTIHSGQPVGASATLYSAPAAQLVAGDMHELTIFALESNVTGRTYVAYFEAPGDRTDLVGPNLSAPTLTSVSSTPYARARGQVPSQIEYPSAADFVIQQGAPGSRRFVILLATATHFGATPTTWDLVVPDFVGTDGFNANWMPSSGQALFAAEAYSMRTAVLFGALPVPGDVIKVAFRELSTTLPQLRARARSIRRGRPSIVGAQYLRR